MEIEVTGNIKALTESINQVGADLEYQADYKIILQLDLDHRSFLALKRMQLLDESLRVTMNAAQLELPEVLQEALEAAVGDHDS